MNTRSGYLATGIRRFLNPILLAALILGLGLCAIFLAVAVAGVMR